MCCSGGFAKSHPRRRLTHDLNKITGDGGIPALAIDALLPFVGIQVGEKMKVGGRRNEDGAGDGLDCPIFPFKSTGGQGFPL